MQMTTLQEIESAVLQLTPEEKQHLLLRLARILRADNAL